MSTPVTIISTSLCEKSHIAKLNNTILAHNHDSLINKRAKMFNTRKLSWRFFAENYKLLHDVELKMHFYKFMFIQELK